MHTVIALCTTIIGLLEILLSKAIYSRYFNPITIFNLAWIISINMSNLNLYGINRPNLNIYLMIPFMIISFFIGNITALKCKKVKVRPIEAGEINIKLLMFLNIIGMIILLPYMIKSINIIATNGLSYLRGVLGSDSGLGLTSNIQWIIVSWIIAPIFNATMIISVVYSFYNRINKKLLFLTILNIVSYTLTFGGRWIIIRLIIVIIFIIFLTNKNIELINRLKKIKKIFLILIIISISILILITSQRSVDNSEIKTLYLYFFAPMSYFNSHLEQSINSPGLFGGAFFAGVIDIPLIIFSIITGIDFARPAEIVGRFTSPTLNIGSDILFNGFGSALMDFWIDFGFSGAIINGLLLGFIVGIIYKMYSLSHNIKNISIYIFTMLLLLLTPIKWECDLQWPWFTYLFIVIFSYKKNNIRRER